MFSIVGTVLHELGHAAMAKYLNVDFTIHHNSVKLSDELSKDYRLLMDSIRFYHSNDSVKKINQDNRNTISKYHYQSFLITLGGPMQTILTSILGIVVLVFRRFKTYHFSIIDWLCVFLALFISREAFLLVYDMFILVIKHHLPHHGDEIKLARLMGIHPLSISAVLGVIGFYTCILVIHKFVPKSYLYEFIIGGCIGGLTGFYFFNVWF